MLQPHGLVGAYTTGTAIYIKKNSLCLKKILKKTPLWGGGHVGPRANWPAHAPPNLTPPPSVHHRTLTPFPLAPTPSLVSPPHPDPDRGSAPALAAVRPALDAVGTHRRRLVPPPPHRRQLPAGPPRHLPYPASSSSHRRR